MTEIGGGWYMEKLLSDYHHLGDQNRVKNYKRKMTRLKKYTKLIVIGMIGNYNYVVTSLSGSVKEVKSK